MTDTTKPVWNSLEVIKLLMGSLTPVTIAVVGIIVQQEIANQNAMAQKQIATQNSIVQQQIATQNSIVQQQIASQDREWKSQQRLLERRLQVYDSIRIELNRVYCFIEDVGTWKDDTPQTVIR